METVTHDDRRIAYRVTDEGGEGPPICFVHGSGGTGATWVDQRELADRYPVVEMDLSGHGDSGDADLRGEAIIEAYADDVAAVCEATGAGVVVGFSLGGAVVLQLLLEGDVDLEAAVLTSTGASLPVHDDLLGWLADDFDRALDFLFQPELICVDPDSEVAETARAEMVETGRETTQRDFLACDQFDVRDRLGEIDVPVLVLGATADRLTPPRYHEYLAEEIPTASHEPIDDAAHMAMRERPARFNDAVATFLEETL